MGTTKVFMGTKKGAVFVAKLGCSFVLFLLECTVWHHCPSTKIPGLQLVRFIAIILTVTKTGQVVDKLNYIVDCVE